MKFYSFLTSSFFILLSSTLSLSKEIKGVIKNQNKKFPINNAYIINLNRLIATSSNLSGHFNIDASFNDTLIIYSLGYEFIKIRVTKDWLKNSSRNEIQLSELAQSVDYILSKKQLTGVLGIDALRGKKNDNVILSISGLDNSGYEFRGSLNSDKPVSFFTELHYKQLLNKRSAFKKLEKINDNPKLMEALRTSFRRELACNILDMKKEQLNTILEKCRFSNYYILYASDLQVLQGIKNCYDNILSTRK